MPPFPLLHLSGVASTDFKLTSLYDAFSDVPSLPPANVYL